MKNNKNLLISFVIVIIVMYFLILFDTKDNINNNKQNVNDVTAIKKIKP